MVPIHNARRFALTFIFSLVSVCTVSTILAADTLDELLGGERTVLKEPSPATKKLWEDLLTALEKSDIEASRPLLTSFIQTNDYVEPYQKTLSLLVVEVLEQPNATAARNANLTARL